MFYGDAQLTGNMILYDNYRKYQAVIFACLRESFSTNVIVQENKVK